MDGSGQTLYIPNPHGPADVLTKNVFQNSHILKKFKKEEIIPKICLVSNKRHVDRQTRQRRVFPLVYTNNVNSVVIGLLCLVI